MKLTSILAFALAALCMTVVFSPKATATPVTWYLDDVTFTGGGTASGQFTFDATTDTYSGISISTSGGSLPAITYTGDFSALSSALSLDATNNIAARFFFLGFASALTNGGGTVNLSGVSFESNYQTTRFASGEVTTTPEPASAALLGLGGGLLFLWRRRPLRA